MNTCVSFLGFSVQENNRWQFGQFQKLLGITEMFSICKTHLGFAGSFLVATVTSLNVFP